MKEDLAAKTAIAGIQQERDTILKQINAYETDTFALIDIGETTRNQFKSLISRVQNGMDELSEEDRGRRE